jgi:hypothetical protein
MLICKVAIRNSNALSGSILGTTCKGISLGICSVLIWLFAGLPLSYGQSSDASNADASEIDGIDGLKRDPRLDVVIQSAPGAFARLIDAGQVTLTTNDAMLRRYEKSALTVFLFKTQHRMVYRYQRVSNDDEGNQRFRVSCSFRNPQFSMSHTIVMPSGFRTTDAWKSTLLKHEFDHVALTTDPRVEKIARVILWQSDQWIETIPAGLRIDELQIETVAEQRFADRRDNFEKSLQNVYDQLDDVSRMGQSAIPNRKEFLKLVYGVDNLERIGIPIDGSIRRLAGRRLYDDVDSHYELIDGEN